MFNNPFDPDSQLHNSGCCCTSCKAPAEAPATSEGQLDRVVESALVRGIFAHDDIRRRQFLRLVGSGTLAAILNSILPLDSVKAAVKDGGGALEKRDIHLSFVPIICASPIIMGIPFGFYNKYGLNVELTKTAGWDLIRFRLLNLKTYDASHLLTPMPLAISLGLRPPAVPMQLPIVTNTNGQAITLANKHKDKRDPKQWKGLSFAVPYKYSMQNYLLRYYVSEHGLDPDKDIYIREVAPPEMVGDLRAGAVDGYLAPEPFNQRAVMDGIGFIHILSKEIWDGHPCCAFACRTDFATNNPNTFQALFKSLIESSAYCAKKENRPEIAKALAHQSYLNQPAELLTQVLTGQFPDGLGKTHSVPNRINFDAFPWHSMAVWILTQMKRWGHIKGDVDYKGIAEEVYRASDCARLMRDLGQDAPASTYRKHMIMGTVFDATAPEAYLSGFKKQPSKA